MLNIAYQRPNIVDLKARTAASSAAEKANAALQEVAGLGALARSDTIRVSQIADPENLPNPNWGSDRDLGSIMEPSSVTIDLGTLV